MRRANIHNTINARADHGSYPYRYIAVSNAVFREITSGTWGVVDGAVRNGILFNVQGRIRDNSTRPDEAP